MGYGAYVPSRHHAVTVARQGASREEVFVQRSMHPQMNPHGLRVREARDSEEHPRSLPILFAFDVTGSMGEVPNVLARETLPQFMSALLDAGLESPQVMFTAVGDAATDQAPLQVGQFEASDERMDPWLTNLWLEGRGGGNSHESYDLAFYLAARHVATDAWEKRRSRGYLLVTGDEKPFPALDPDHVARVFGTTPEGPIPLLDLVREVCVRWHPFFLIPSPDRDPICGASWRSVLGDRVIVLGDPKDTALVAAALVALTEGALPSLEALVAQLRASGRGGEQVERIVRSVEPWAHRLGITPSPTPAVSSRARDGVEPIPASTSTCPET